MIYIRMKFLCCILIMSLLTAAHSQRSLNMRQKLERLLEDPEYNDITNEIHKPRQIQGMLLKDLREHGLFDTSSEERFFRKMSKSFEKTSAISQHSEEEKSSLPQTTESTTSKTTTTTTKSTPIIVTTVTTPTEEILTTNKEEMSTMATSSEQQPSRVIGNLGSIISKFIDMWRN